MKEAEKANVKIMRLCAQSKRRKPSTYSWHLCHKDVGAHAWTSRMASRAAIHRCMASRVAHTAADSTGV